MSEPSRRVEFLTDLAPIVEGDPAVLAKHADLLESNPAVRELRAQASELAQWIAQAGADFEPGDALATAIARTLRQRGDTSDGVAQEADDEGRGADAMSEAQREPKAAPKRVLAVALIGLLLTAAGAGAAYFAGVIPGLSPASQAAPTTKKKKRLAAPRSTLSATVARLASATADGSGLTKVDGESAALPVGGQLAAGDALETDAFTRAELTLSNGSTVLLNHSTQLALDAKRSGLFVLKAGELLIDAAESKPGDALKVQTPHGLSVVTGTKFSIVAGEEQTSVRVARGGVQLTPSGGEALLVLAGQEGIATKDGTGSVTPLVNLGSDLRWSELPDDETGEEIVGLGELRAHAPGESQEPARNLSLAEHKVSVHIAGNMARTEIEEAFHNDGDQELEGVYRFPLPPNARIDSLSLLVDGKWKEGAFVERERGRKIWSGVMKNAADKKKKAKKEDEYIWVPGPWRDPALLQWQQGGRFELRIFPIPAQGERRVRLSYSEVLTPTGNGRRYTYPLSHAQGQELRVGRFEVEVSATGADAGGLSAHGYPLEGSGSGDTGLANARLFYAQEDFLPNGDLAVDVAQSADSELAFWTYRGPATVAPGRETAKRAPELAAEQAKLHSDERGYVALALRPKLPAWKQGKRQHHVLLVDSSQSMFGERFARARSLSARIVREMDRRDSFELLACDATCSALDDKPLLPSAQSAQQVAAWLADLRPAGASDIDAALQAAAKRLAPGGSEKQTHVVYIGDGIASIGARQLSTLTAEARKLFGKPEVRFSTVGIGSDADQALLRGLARAGGGHYLPYVPGQSAAQVALDVLETGYGVSLTDAKLILPDGLTDVAPVELATLRSGEELLITARMQDDKVTGELVLTGTVGGQPFENRYPLELEVSTAEGNRFVPALWASERIAQEQLQGDPEAATRITALSTTYGVISRYTSLLVLESPAMFEAFGIDAAQARPVWTGKEEAEGGESEGLVDIDALAGVATQQAEAASNTGEGAASGPAARRSKGKAAAPSADDPLAGLTDDDAERADEADTRVAEKPPVGRWVKREWVRVATIDDDPSVSDAVRRAVDEAVEALEEKPDSRDRHRKLVRLLSLLGNLERTTAAVEEWIARDALDPEALTYLADAIGRQGKRALAIRVLTGIVDLQPDNVVLQSRMARAFERAKLWARACAHRRAIAEIEADKVESLSAAVRCLNKTERAAAAERLLQGLPESLRQQVQAAAAEAPETERPAGDLIISASWEGDQDIDLTLVTSEGTRVSWLGGRVNVVGDDATAAGHERLGFERVSAGSYLLEVTRTTDDKDPPVQGKVTIEALGKTKRIPFELKATRQRVARITVRREARLAAP